MKLKYTAYTTKAFEIVLDENEDIGDIDPNDNRWTENHEAGGGWEIPDAPQEYVEPV